MNLRDKKIINAIKYFVKNTKYVGRTKLFKLLYYWDFYFFEKHGKSITGFKYYTYPFGPVPKEFYDHIIEEDLPDFYKNQITLEEDKNIDFDDGFKRFKVSLNDNKVDLDVFTPYEKEMLEHVAFIFEAATAKDMTEATHFPNTPWSRTLEKEGKFKEIDYFLAKSEDTPFDEEEIRERMYLREKLLHNGYN